MLPRKNWISAGLGGLLVAAGGARAVELTAHSQTLLDESMGFLDTIYDAKAGYLDYFYYPQAAGRHETRSSVWYATGLLQRNRGGDAAEAAKIIRNVVAGQATDPSAQWFGDYTVYPEQPTVGRGDYAPRIYNTWDPNWRGFIGTNLMVIYEEFGALLPADVRELIVASLYNATVGDGYRVGGVDGDNLYPSYSNPWIMRAAAAGWTGRKLGDANLTAAGEADARAFLDLFDRNGTLSEFNSPTYAGVSLYALTLWAKYLPAADSLMGAHGARLVREVWATSARLYNANLRNLAGPWDRAYGYDMNLYVGIFNLYIWTLVGKDRAPVQARPWAMAHADDFEYAPLIAVLAPFHDSLVPAETRAHFEGFVGGERLFETAVFSPPHDRVPRNVTAWVAPHLTIGAESFDEDVVGGPAKNPSQWTPAVAQWSRADGSVGFLAFSPTESAAAATVAPGCLELAYPRGNATSAFTFLVGANPLDGGRRDVASLADIEGVAVGLDAAASSVHPVPHVTFCGLVGGSCSPNHGFEFWNFTFVMPANSSATPSIRLTFELDS